tara:strand:+ start:1031 stop:1180 length:150 start_codon:yes stop_codon:yes gene_type:complete
MNWDALISFGLGVGATVTVLTLLAFAISPAICIKGKDGFADVANDDDDI